MKGTFNTLLSLALVVSCGSAMAQDSTASKAGYRSQGLESQVYRGLASFAAGDGHTVDPKSVEINLNRHGVTAIAPYHTDMFDIDLSTNFMLGAVYYEAARASASLPSGHYTLMLSQPAEGGVEFQFYNAQGQLAHVTPAKIEVMPGSGVDPVEASARATGEADQPIVINAHADCWFRPDGGTVITHGRCWTTTEPVIQ